MKQNARIRDYAITGQLDTHAYKAEKDGKAFVIKPARDFESEALQRCSHPRIPELQEVLDTKEVSMGIGVRKSIRKECPEHLVLRYINGKLLWYEVIQAHAMPSQEVQGYALQIAKMVSHIHNRGYVYNDLKPTNIIVNEGQIHLIDLGSCIPQRTGAFMVRSTPGFRCQDQEQGINRLENDTYGLGATIDFMLTKDYQRKRPKTAAEVSELATFYSRYLDTGSASMAAAMLSPDASDRPRMDEVIATLEQRV